MYKTLLKSLLFQLPPEAAHHLTFDLTKFSFNLPLIKGLVNQNFEFELDKESEENCPLSLPKQFLYEPNAAIMKSGGFNQIGIQTGLAKLHTPSHLYTGNKLIEFTGRRFEIKEVIPATGKELKRKLKGSKANVTTRNYPQKVEEIRKSLNLKDGGQVYLFFTTNCEKEKVCLVCEKV